MPVIDRPWCAKKKYFSRHLLVLARYPTRERTFLPWMSCRGWMVQVYPPPSRTCTHLRRDTSNADLSLPSSPREGTSVLLNVICCRIPREPSSHFSNGRQRRKRRRSLKSSVSFPPRGENPRTPLMRNLCRFFFRSSFDSSRWKIPSTSSSSPFENRWYKRYKMRDEKERKRGGRGKNRDKNWKLDA